MCPSICAEWAQKTKMESSEFGCKSSPFMSQVHVCLHNLHPRMIMVLVQRLLERASKPEIFPHLRREQVVTVHDIHFNWT